MEGAADEEGNAAVTTPPPTCPVCMEPWTCNGDHRICCIPCGHVYDRSCLERWLHRSAHNTAKCPQCGEQFEDKLITNLYAPGNLWDGCCHLQELKAHYESIVKEMEGDVISMVTELTANLESEIDRLVAKVKEVTAELHADFKEHAAKMHAKLKKQSAKDQMKKMAEQENVTATDLIEFMERSFPQLSLISGPCTLPGSGT